MRVQSSNESTSVDIFDVFSFCSKELLSKVESEYNQTLETQPKRMRLAAVLLALHYDHLDTLIMFSGAIKSTTIIATEVQNVECQMDVFAAVRLNDVICLVYFKLMHLLAKINYNVLKNFGQAKHWLKSSERMYLELISLQDRQHYYDFRALFSKSSNLKIVNAPGFEVIDQLFAENTELLEKIQQNECNNVQSVFECLQMHKDTAILLGKILSTIPQLLEQRAFKSVAYFLLLAQKLCGDGGDIKVQSSIANNWIRYTFGVFSRSHANVIRNLREDQMVYSMKFLMSSAAEPNIDGCRMLCNSTTAKKTVELPSFNCFADLLPLNEDELQLCMDSIETISQANMLLNYSIEMLEKLLLVCDFQNQPLDFIAHHYQMSDLLSIAAIFADSFDQSFNYHVQRFHNFRQMIATTEKSYPDIMKPLQTTLLFDLSEIVLDLYAINFDRILQATNFGGDGRIMMQRQMKHQLVELNEMTKHLILTTNPITKASHD